MKNKKLLSIIIPTHNSEKTIIECLSSIYCQLNKNIEVIVIDDGSTDKTVNVVKNRTLPVRAKPPGPLEQASSNQPS